MTFDEERLRRLWRELTYDPIVELQRAKELLARRLEWSETEEHERRGPAMSQQGAGASTCVDLMTAEQGETRDAWPWPEALDALSAAPRHHSLLFEKEHVRVLETRIMPGDCAPVHTHHRPSVLYVLSWSDFVRRDADGELVVDSRAAGGGSPPTPPAAIRSPALPPHSLENVGSTEIRVVSVELKHVAA